MFNRILDWAGDHPATTIMICTLLFFGVLAAAVALGLITTQTKLMPY